MSVQHSVLDVKVLVGAFNQEKALVLPLLVQLIYQIPPVLYILTMDSNELFDYILDLPSDNVLDICDFVLLGGEEENRELQAHAEQPGQAYTTLGCSNNNNNSTMDFQTEANNNRQSRDGEKGPEHCPGLAVTQVVKAKRGRPPSKPPSKEVLKSRRKVSFYISCFHTVVVWLRAAPHCC